MEIDIDISSIIGQGHNYIHRRKTVRYGKYADAITPHVEWIKDQIRSRKDGIVRVKTIDVTKEMGREFVNKDPMSIYWGLKYVLFKEGIIVDTGVNKSGENMLTMRLANEKDILPQSLDRYLKLEEKNNPSECISGDVEKFITKEKMLDIIKFKIDDIFS